MPAEDGRKWPMKTVVGGRRLGVGKSKGSVPSCKLSVAEQREIVIRDWRLEDQDKPVLRCTVHRSPNRKPVLPERGSVLRSWLEQ